MSNINELKAKLKAAAECASGGEWVKESGDGWEAVCSADDQANGGFIIAALQGTDARANREFIQAANPAAVLELIAALEAAQNRNAELEARTFSVKRGEVLVTVTGFTGSGKSAIAGEIEIALLALGVPVEWTNSAAEKRTTGADWLTAIETYKPRVKIIEVNVPRKAGINLETGCEA
ncbi:ead/Ea22-like family protein [Cronobacter dublinensis]|nr:ead/Ea22-like family protein [Cronobacter dublinensis]